MGPVISPFSTVDVVSDFSVVREDCIETGSALLDIKTNMKVPEMETSSFFFNLQSSFRVLDDSWTKSCSGEGKSKPNYLEYKAPETGCLYSFNDKVYCRRRGSSHKRFCGN